MPWRGPREPGEFPTLGYDVGEWMETFLVQPDGWNEGRPFRLTDEQWLFLLHYYRLWPDAQPWPSTRHLFFTGGQLRRAQKWGKDPFAGGIIWAEALGPTQFAGWDAAGDPVGRPYPTPLIVCLGTSGDQTDNTYRPLLGMGRKGPLANVNGLDIGDTRVALPGGGKIEPVTTSAKARLGAPLTYLTITESHLFTLQGGYRKVAGAVKRNVAGMDGRWLELTNAWDPTEMSEAQVTGMAGDPRILIDNIGSQRVEDLRDTPALRAELLRQYGDSARERGGWVNLDRILGEAQSDRHFEADRRRYFLNEEVVGQSTLVDPTVWDAVAEKGLLAPAARVALGFDGSKWRDATALVACRLEDGRLFEVGVWERPEKAPADWHVPSAEVDEVVRAAFKAYRVLFLFADPYRWQDYLDAWAAAFPDRVVEFPTNAPVKMDGAIERFQTAFTSGAISHSGASTLTQHMKNAVVTKGDRKRPRPGEEVDLSTHYLKLAKRSEGLRMDAAVAAVLAYEARAHAIAEGALEMKPQSTATVFDPDSMELTDAERAWLEAGDDEELEDAEP